MRTGVYVGSFDPLHKGHTGVMNTLLDGNYLDRIIVVATNNYWHKKLKVDISR